MPEASTRKFSAELKARSESRLQAGQTGLLCEAGVGSRLIDAWRKADRAYRATGLIARDSLIPHFGSERAIPLRRLLRPADAARDRRLHELGRTTPKTTPRRKASWGTLKSEKVDGKVRRLCRGRPRPDRRLNETVCDPRRLHSAP
jgi:hypothetical protein